ncbi:hypothetical protein ANO14919_061520 [Xylariales sp. No.14919]|nr:hypothetical protein ANO14919_061520 [Xylariales sp. No.14919]
MTPIKILDGGLGTSLVDKYDVVFDEATPLWSTHLIIDGQDTLQACQRDFVQAGADVLLTATYQTSIEGFARTKTPRHPDGISKPEIGPYLSGAVDVAAKAARGRGEVQLALSLGPYGACMVPSQEYTGDYDAAHGTEEALYQWHLERFRLFAETEGVLERVQMMALETVPRIDEIRALRRAVAACGIALPFWVSCVFPRDDGSLPDGSTMVQVVEAMLDPSVEGPVPWGIGINCTKMQKLPGLVRTMGSSVRQMLSQRRIPSAPSVVLYPDGVNGKVYNVTTKRWELSDDLIKAQSKTSWASELARFAKDVRDTGIFSSVLVGGCCKSSAADIAVLRHELES